MPVCEIDDCGKPRHGARWCGMHYRRNLYRGDPLAPNLNDDPVSTFWSYVNKTETCWLWTACLSRGYGIWKAPRGFPIRTQLAHRVAYYLVRGPIPDDGPALDHLCRVKHCVNPEHLEPVTPEENLRRHWALITRCPAGHAYDEANTLYKGNSRNCRACNAARERRRRAAARE